MELATNPFYRLDATMQDSRQRIADLAEKKSLVEDETAVREARRILTSPAKRLAAEVGWFPGLSPAGVAKAISVLHANPTEVRTFADVIALTRANLLAEGLLRARKVLELNEMAQWIVELAEAQEASDPEAISEILNHARYAAGFPAISNQESVETELQCRRRYFRDVIKRSLDQLPTRALVKTVRMTVDGATRDGTRHAPALIDDLVATYETEAQEFMEKETEHINSLIDQTREAASVQNSGLEVEALTNKLEQVLRNWDDVVQPIQLSYSTRGLAHELSRKVAGRVRELAVELYNESNLLDVSIKLTAVQRAVFAEDERIAEQAEEDASRLDELVEERDEAQARIAAQTEQWAREITYEASVGLMKNRLHISSDGVRWKGSTIRLDEISRVRWSATRHSINGIPTGTTYAISVGGERTVVEIPLKDERVFSEFVDRLWKSVGVRLLTEMLEELRNGAQYQFGTAVVNDYGMVLERSRIFRASENVRCRWNQLSIWNGSGSFCIAKKDDRKVAVELPYGDVDNVHVLEAALQVFWKRASPRLSDLLEAET